MVGASRDNAALHGHMHAQVMPRVVSGPVAGPRLLCHLQDGNDVVAGCRKQKVQAFARMQTKGAFGGCVGALGLRLEQPGSCGIPRQADSSSWVALGATRRSGQVILHMSEYVGIDTCNQSFEHCRFDVPDSTCRHGRRLPSPRVAGSLRLLAYIAKGVAGRVNNRRRGCCPGARAVEESPRPCDIAPRDELQCTVGHCCHRYTIGTYCKNQRLALAVCHVLAWLLCQALTPPV